jgi:hypothetical protein
MISLSHEKIGTVAHIPSARVWTEAPSRMHGRERFEAASDNE